MRRCFTKSVVITVFFLLHGLAISGCTEKSGPLRLGTSIWPGYEPLYLARELGLLDTNKIRLVAYPSAREVIRAFRNHSLEAASMTLDEAMQLIEHDLPVKIVLVHDISHGADVILAKPGIAKVSALRGHTIGVESSAGGAYVITRALQKNNLDFNEVKFKPLDVNQHLSAYRSGDIDAAVTFEPFSAGLKKAGALEIFSSREIPGEIIDVMVVHEDIHESRLPELKHITRSWFAALQYIEEEPDQAGTIMGMRLKLSKEDVLDTYESLQMPTHAQNVLLLEGEGLNLRKFASLMWKQQRVGQNLKLTRALNTDALH